MNTFLVWHGPNTRYQNEKSKSKPSGDGPEYVEWKKFNYQDCFQKLSKVEDVHSSLLDDTFWF